MSELSLGDRMKGYEKVPQQKLMSKTPVVIRLDGKAFHTYTRCCDKPFDSDLHYIRQQVLKYLCENIQGCILGYSQSDEISLVLKDWETYQSSAWFGNKIQKLCSVSASMATAEWNCLSSQVDGESTSGSNKFDSHAIFDARCFNLPINEVVNYLIWRQQDWERNSVQMLGQSLYSHKELHKVSCKQMITNIENDHSIVWGELPSWQKQGEVWINGEIKEDFIFKENRLEVDTLMNLTSNHQC
jgi:tRNA(His) guanylyltransferase